MKILLYFYEVEQKNRDSKNKGNKAPFPETFFN